MEPLQWILILSGIEVDIVDVGLVNCAMFMKYQKKETKPKEKYSIQKFIYFYGTNYCF